MYCRDGIQGSRTSASTSSQQARSACPIPLLAVHHGAQLRTCCRVCVLPEHRTTRSTRVAWAAHSCLHALRSCCCCYVHAIAALMLRCRADASSAPSCHAAHRDHGASAQPMQRSSAYDDAPQQQHSKCSIAATQTLQRAHHPQRQRPLLQPPPASHVDGAAAQRGAGPPRCQQRHHR